MERNNVEKLRTLVSRSRVGMLGTLENGRMQFRPMSHVDIDDEGKLWFFTSKESWKAADIHRSPFVQLIYSNESDSIYLTIDGIARIDEDYNRMKELFNPFVKAWFPKGLKDPQLALLVVDPVEIEYWSNDDSKILTYLKILTSAVTGSQPDVGDHEKLSVK